MKRHIILFISILLIGSLAIILPNFLSSYYERREAERLEFQKEENYKVIQEISSTINTIDDIELSDEVLESEFYNDEQIYFDGIENIYNYLNFGEVESIKQKIQFYIHQNIDKSLMDCQLIGDTIRQDDNSIYFSIQVDNNNVLEIETNKDKTSGTVDVTIIHNISNEYKR